MTFTFKRQIIYKKKWSISSLLNHRMLYYYILVTILTNYSAVALGTAFSHLSGQIAAAPVIGAACKRAQQANTREEFIKSREASSAACIWTNSLVTSGVQSYAFCVLLYKCGVTSVNSAACIGSLVFAVSSLPDILTHAIVDRRPLDQVLASTATALFDTVGLASLLAWWGYVEPTVKFENRI